MSPGPPKASDEPHRPPWQSPAAIDAGRGLRPSKAKRPPRTADLEAPDAFIREPGK